MGIVNVRLTLFGDTESTYLLELTDDGPSVTYVSRADGALVDVCSGAPDATGTDIRDLFRLAEDIVSSDADPMDPIWSVSVGHDDGSVERASGSDCPPGLEELVEALMWMGSEGAIRCGLE